MSILPSLERGKTDWILTSIQEIFNFRFYELLKHLLFSYFFMICGNQHISACLKNPGNVIKCNFFFFLFFFFLLNLISKGEADQEYAKDKIKK